MKFHLLLTIIVINLNVLIDCYYYDDYYDSEYYYVPLRSINRQPYRRIRYFGGTKLSGLEYKKLPPKLRDQVDSVRAGSKAPDVPPGYEIVESGDDTEIIAVEQEVEDTDVGGNREETREEWGKDKKTERNRITKAKARTTAKTGAVPKKSRKT